MYTQFTMTNFISSMDLSKDKELSRLRVENKALHEELTQCQADKEFVWSLWKRLQVANPDITQAVGMVVQREKEKAEVKDRKILEILNGKDNKIDELQQLVSEQSEEIRSLITRKLEFEDRTSALENENANLKYRVRSIDEGTTENASREAVRELDMENLELKQKLQRQASEIDRLKEDKADMGALRDTSRDRLKNLEEELDDANRKHAVLNREYDEMKKLLKKYENQLMSLQKDVSSKNKELEGVRKELSELWTTHQQTTDHANQQAELIRQLQDLQKDTQKMLQNTETAYSMEAVSLHTENSSLKSTHQDMTRQMHQQSKTIQELQDMISELQQQLEERQAHTKHLHGYEDDYSDLDYRLQSLQKDMNSLKGSLSARRTRESSTSTSQTVRSRGGKTKLRSRSLSPHRENDLRILQRKLENTERKLSDAHLLLHVKTKELDELRTAHNNRLERLKCVQSNHKLAKKHLALLEEEIHGPRRKKKRLTRSHPKSLQKEDSDAVWNEVTYYRKENKNLKVENVNLLEERDTLKVKLSQIEASNHELKTCLEQEREELQFMLEQERERSASQDQQEELARLHRQLEHYRKQVDKLKRQLDQLWGDHSEDKERSDQEKRALKSEINILRQQDSAQRVKIADFKKEISRLQRELKKSQKKVKSPSGKAKHYQQTLNKSIKEMSEVFDGINKDGWEDVTDSENQLTEITGTSATTETAHSLGDAIVQHAQNSLREGDSFTSTEPTEPRLSSTPSPRPTDPRFRPHREVEAEEAHYRRLARRDEPGHEVERRSVALSPVRFDPPHTRSVGLSPIQLPSPTTRPHIVSKKVGMSPSNNTRLVVTLRQRVSTLQNQVITLKHAKESATRNNTELKNLLEQLQSDMQSSNSKLQTHRLTIQRQHQDLDKLRAEKEELEHRLHDQNAENTAAQHSDQEFANLQTRLKNASNEVSKQLVQIKEYKAEIASLQEKILQLQDRVKSLERDNSQKRILVDDMKMKMKSVQESVQSDAQVMEDVGQKVRTLNETNQRYKTQIESFKTRLSAVSKEKFDNEDKVIKLTQELDKKNKQVSELQSRVRSLQSTVAVVEKTAKQQLTSLADQSEVAIDVAQGKLMEAGAKLQEYSKFVKVFSHSLVNSLQQSRYFLNQQKIKREQKQIDDALGRGNASVRKFQNVACDILNLSQSDLDDILSSDISQKGQLGDVQNVEDLKKDKRWAKRWEKALQTKEEFAVPLVELFMEKVEERCQVATEIAIT